MARTRKLRNLRKSKNKRNTKKGGAARSPKHSLSHTRSPIAHPNDQHSLNFPHSQIYDPPIYINNALYRLSNIALEFQVAVANDDISEILIMYQQIIKLEKEFNQFIKHYCSLTCERLSPTIVLKKIQKLKDKIDSKIKQMITDIKKYSSILSIKVLYGIITKLNKMEEIKNYDEFDQILSDLINTLEIISNKLIENSQDLNKLVAILKKLQLLFPHNDIIEALIVKALEKYTLP